MKYVMILLTIILVIGCSTTKDLGEIAVESAFISAEIGSGNVSNTLHSTELTSDEKQVIVQALNYQNQFEEKWKGSLKDPFLIMSVFTELNTDYLILKSHYLATREIVINNWDRYPEVSKFRLTNYQKHADNLDASVDKLNAAGEKRQVLQEMLYFSSTVAQIAISVK